ncbi:hypothetical protein GCM10007939_15790 [Amylibacter marinus]|uniref:IPT/TIG domain-containing protein n=1 Tax=Amylibacter marinus TaxID=1475483 RepID=A0ABQ5VV48_9RHOB|nr:hypothetical protein [Amylibacter marinus]GLQ35296.1 hypothetical protein GCM10007939_15790 [Amylibacter marinus]
MGDKNVKLFSTFAVALSLAITSFTGAAMAENDPYDSVLFKRIENSELGVEFSVPKDAEVKTVSGDASVKNPLLVNGRRLLKISDGPAQVSVIAFDVNYDFHPIDWLDLYAEISGLNSVSAKISKNYAGERLGEMTYLPIDGNSTTALAYVAIAGNTGYLIIGSTLESQDLVVIAAGSLELDAPGWGGLDAKKEITIAGQSFMVPETFSVHNSSKDGKEVRVITNGPEVTGSSIVMIVKTSDDADHADNTMIFKKKLKNLKLRSAVLSQNDSQTILSAESGSGQLFTGYVSTLDSGFVIELLVPKLTFGPDAWLTGRSYYIEAIRALR